MTKIEMYRLCNNMQLLANNLLHNSNRLCDAMRREVSKNSFRPLYVLHFVSFYDTNRCMQFEYIGKCDLDKSKSQNEFQLEKFDSSLYVYCTRIASLNGYRNFNSLKDQLTSLISSVACCCSIYFLSVPLSPICTSWLRLMEYGKDSSNAIQPN